MIKIAMPKGRLGSKIYALLAAAGYGAPDYSEDSRKLVFESADGSAAFFFVKPSDVPTYVEYGAADIGVVGSDILLEGGASVYELLDLGVGICRMAVAAKKNFRDDLSRPLRVATKFPKIACDFYASRGREVEIIKLSGSIELAPILEMSDVIVDIVETGKTLYENNLEVYDTIVPISARLISNKSSFKFHGEEIARVRAALEAALKK